MRLTLSHTEIDDLRKAGSPDAAYLKTFRRYARGDQNRMTSTAQRRAIGKSTQPIADNVLNLIITTAASRLDLEGYAVSAAIDPPDPNTPEGAEKVAALAAYETSRKKAEAVQIYLDGFYLRNQLGRKQYDTIYASLRDGNHAIVLRWKAADENNPAAGGRVVAHRERWWDGKSGIFVGYDGDDPVWAVKEWEEKEGKKTIRRRIVYYPDRLERYVQEGASWQPYALPGDPEEDQEAGVRKGVIKWEDPSTGLPLGLPVIHFPNGTDDDSPYGRSEMAGLLGIQDDLNAMQVDIAAAAAFTGFQMVYVTGEKSATGEDLIVGPGRTLEFANKDVRVGVIPAGDMSALTEAHGYKRQTMAVDSATPMHLISGQWPSGEALIRSEMPLLDKIRRLARIAGPQWVLVAHRACEIWNAFAPSGGGLDEAAPISASFAAPERLDPITETAIAQARINLYASLTLISDPVLLRKAAKESGVLSDDEVELIIVGRQERALGAGEEEGQEGEDTEDEEESEEPPAGSF